MNAETVANRLDRAVEVMTEVVAAVPAEEWSAPSPCEGWTARDVLSHVLGTVGKASAAIGGAAYGATPSDPRANLAGDPVAAWRGAAAELRRSLRGADLDRVLPDGRTLAETLRLPIADLSVHAWDIGAATGLPMRLPDELIEHVRAVVDAVPAEQLRSPGFFGPPVEAPPRAHETDVLMAHLGRSRRGVGSATSAGAAAPAVSDGQVRA